MSTWNTTSMNSRFGSTGAGPAIEGSSSTAWRSKQSPSIPSRTSPWSDVPRGQRLRPQSVGAKTGNLSEVNNHLAKYLSCLGGASLLHRPFLYHLDHCLTLVTSIYRKNIFTYYCFGDFGTILNFILTSFQFTIWRSALDATWKSIPRVD